MAAAPLDRTARSALFAGGGDMGRRIAAHDWGDSLLGPIEHWPEALVNAVSLLLPASVEIVLFWGPDYVALYNDAYAPTIGDKHPAALGCPARKCWSELWDDLEPLLAHVRTTGETFSAKDRPFYIERGDGGEEVYFDISYSPVRLADGSVGGVLCIVSETTERVRGERELRLSRERLMLATEAAEIGTWDLDLATEALAWSANTKAMFGVAADAVVDMDLFWAALHPDDRAPTAAAFEAALDPARRALYEVEYRTIGMVDGVTRWIAAKGRAVFDADGNTVRAIGTTIDITRRKRSAERLRESEERFRQLADSAPALIWLTGADGRIVFTNRWFQTLLGITEEEMRREGWMRVVPPEDRAQIAQDRDRVRSSYEPFGGDMRVLDGEGRDRWIHVEGRPRFLDGEFQGFIGCAIEVTEAHLAGEALEARIAERTTQLTEQIAERERVEATLHQMQRLEAVGQVTSGVAHDFNNLLTVVLGNIGLIERAAAKAALDERTLQRLEHVRTAAERGAKLTAQLLAFSRRQRLEARAIDLNATVAGMRDLLQSSLGGAIAIETRLGDALWPALVDATQIELIILNLAINARDAMETGGTVSVATANVTLGAPTRPEEPAAGDYVRVAVSDAGAGMSDEIRAKAFEPFFTTKAVGKGSGLGLAQVFGFAKQSGGGVRIDSTPGEGTTVSVYLPRAATLTPVTEAPRPAPAGSVAGRTVLVLDDDDQVRSVTADELRDAGCRVIEAADGAAALDALAAEAGIEAVVADFAMPGMNGAQFAAHAHERRPDLPVLFVTGYADLAAIAHVPDDAVIQKPYAPGAVAARVRQLLDQKPDSRLATFAPSAPTA